MRNIWTLFRKELAGFFNSPIAYIVLGFFLLTAGWLFWSAFFLVNESSLRAFFGFAPLLVVIFAPAITMRLVAEERKSGSLELLCTLPLSDTQVILAKFLAGLALLGVGYALTLAYPLSVAAVGRLDWGPVIGGYIGILFLSASLLAIGLLASTWSANQIVALIVGLSVGFAFYLVDKFAFFLPDAFASLFVYLSIDTHFENFARGVLDTRDVIYYLSLTGMALYLAVRSLGLRRNA